MLNEEEIKKALRMLGAKTSNRGYFYIAYGILLTLKDKSYLEYITKKPLCGHCTPIQYIYRMHRA